MKTAVRQGDILKIENVKYPILVTSKNFFNQSGEIIGCPIFSDGFPSALHIPIESKDLNGFVHCEKITLFDLRVRGYSKFGTINLSDIINITDAIQGIFDYI